MSLQWFVKPVIRNKRETIRATSYEGMEPEAAVVIPTSHHVEQSTICLKNCYLGDLNLASGYPSQILRQTIVI